MTQAKLFTTHNFNEILSLSEPQLPSLTNNSSREPVLILVISSEKGIEKIIHQLYLHRFADVKEWSRLLPAHIPGRLMRSLLRYVTLD